MNTGKESEIPADLLSEHADRVDRIIARWFKALPDPHKEVLKKGLIAIIEPAHRKYGGRMKYMGAWEIIENLRKNPDDRSEHPLEPYVSEIVKDSDIEPKRAEDVLSRGIQRYIDDMNIKVPPPKKRASSTAKDRRSERPPGSSNFNNYF